MNQRRAFIRNVLKGSALAVISPSILFKSSNACGAEPGDLNHALDLRTSLVKNKPVLVKGKVFDKTGQFPQPGATIEIQNSANYLFSNGNTRLKTNEKGEYRFWIDMPEREKGKAPRIKFTVANAEKSYASELIITDFNAHISGEHWTLNQQLGNRLFPVKENYTNHSEVRFDLSV